MANQNESAIVVTIPETETLVRPFRMQFDPSALLGIPAHVTILFPFKSPDQLSTDLISFLGDLFRELPSFNTLFKKVMQFPDALFLAPEPSEPFRQMTRLIASHFPDTPPYRGAFKEIVPHLTIAQISDPQQLIKIADDFQKLAHDKLPILARVNMVSLFENSSGYWKELAQFHLSQDTQAS
jgi:2'-5' RNA ligase